jgi:hypothetical protein
MVTQFVPSLTSVHHEPAVAGRIAVAAVSVSIGLTLELALITVYAAIFLIISSLPVQLDAVGRVIVIVAVPFIINQFSVAATVKSVVFVTGAPRPKDPTISNLFCGLVVPIPTLPEYFCQPRLCNPLLCHA